MTPQSKTIKFNMNSKITGGLVLFIGLQPFWSIIYYYILLYNLDVWFLKNLEENIKKKQKERKNK